MLARITDRFGRAGLLRHVSALAGGAAAGHAVTVLVSPILTRLYSPAAFGEFAVFTSALAVLLSVACFRFEMAIPLPEQDEAASDLVWVALVSVGLWTILTAGLVTLTGLVDLPESLQRVAPQFWLLPIAVLCGGVSQVLRSVCGRRGSFGVAAKSLALQSTARAAAQLGLAPVLPNSLGLNVGHVASLIIGNVKMFAVTRALLVRSSLARTRSAARRYREFAALNTPAALITTLGLGIPAFLLTSWFEAGVAGHYSLTMRILGLPSVIVGQAVAQVVYPRLAEELRAGGDRSRSFVERIASGLLVISFPLFGAVALLGRPVFSLVFGAQWAEAGVYAELLAPSFFFGFITAPIAGVVLASERQLQILLVTGLELALRVGAIALGGVLASPRTAVTAWSVVAVLISWNYGLWVFRIVGVSLRRWAKSLARYLTGGLAVVAVLIAMRWIIGAEGIGYVVLVGAGFGVHAVLWGRDVLIAVLGSRNPEGPEGVTVASCSLLPSQDDQAR